MARDGKRAVQKPVVKADDLAQNRGMADNIGANVSIPGPRTDRGKNQIWQFSRLSHSRVPR